MASNLVTIVAMASIQKDIFFAFRNSKGGWFQGWADTAEEAELFATWCLGLRNYVVFGTSH